MPRSPWLHALAVFVVASLLAVAAVVWQYRANARAVDAGVEAMARSVTGHVEARMRGYEYGLRGARGAVVAAGVKGVTREAFLRYSLTRDIEREFPGARGFGFIRRVPQAQEPAFLANARRDAPGFELRQLAAHAGDRFVIQYIEPQEPNAAAVGLDIASESNRRHAALRAMREARAALTGPITLVQAQGKQRQSFLLLLPIYASATPPGAVADRETATAGWAYAPLSIDEVIGDLGEQSRNYRLSLRDLGDEATASAAAPFYASPGGVESGLVRLARRLPLSVYGRHWEAEVTPTPAFVTALQLRSPTQTAMEATVGVALLTALAWFYGQAKAKSRALSREQAQRAAMVEAALDAFVGVSLDGRITTWNDAARDIFGWTADEARGRPVDALLLPASRVEEGAPLLHRIRQGQHVPTYDTTRRRRDGREVDVAISMAPLRDDQGHVVGMVKTLRDISAAKAAERGLQRLAAELESKVTERTATLVATQRDLRNILDALPSMVGYWDQGLRNRFANQAYRNWLGERGSELAGKTMAELLGPELFERNRTQVEAALRGEPQTFERSITRPDGQGERHSLAHYLPDVIDGQVQGFYVLVHDVTELTQTRRTAAAALRDNEFLLDTIHRHAIMSMTDRAGRITEVNDAFCEISGYSREELLGSTHRIVHSGTQGPNFWAEVWRCIESGVAWRGEVCNRANNGSLYWVDSIIAPFVDAQGRVERFISIRFDITERKRAAAELQATHARLSLATNAAGIGVWEYDVVADTLSWDARMFRIHGKPQHAGLQSYAAWADGVHPQDLPAAQALFQDALAGRREFSTEFRVCWPTGEIRHIRAAADVQRNAAGDAVRLVGVNWDITERKSAELDLAETTSLLRSVLDAASEVSIVATGPDFVIRFFNLGAEKLLGYQADEVVGSATPGLFHDLAEIQARAQELGRTLGRVVRADQYFRQPQAQGVAQAWTYLRKGGERVPVSLVVTCMLDAAGQVLGYLGIAHDISMQLSHEKMLLDSKSAAEKANLAKSQFLATMSHEIRTPMNAVIALSFLLGQTKLNTQQGELLTKMNQASKTLLGIINDVLDLSRIEAGELGISPQPFSPLELVRHLLDVMRVQADAKAIHVAHRLPDALPALVLGDSLRVNQILTNLLGNAIKFTDEGSVTLTVRSLPAPVGQAQLRFEVQDTGIGIAPEAARSLFQPFAQADSSITRRFGGTGLGLSIVKELADLMGGRVGFASEPGIGSTFWAELPFALTDDADLLANSSRSMASVDRNALAGVRVLVVDDSEINLEVAKRILESVGARVDLATNGSEAFDHLRQHPDAFDLVLMDVHMPVMDGMTATRLIRQDLGLRDLPIVALTAGALASERQEARFAGMSDFIAKPFQPIDVIASIARHTGRVGASGRAGSDVVAQAPASGAWPQVAGIDSDDVERRLDGDQSLFRTLLGLLLKDFPSLPLPGAKGDDMRKLASRLHKLRGSAGNVGATDIHAMATLAEQACRHNDLTNATSQIVTLNRMLASLARASEALVSEGQVAATGANLSLAHVDNLVRLLRQQHIEALSLFEALAEPLRHQLGEQRFSDLRLLIDQLRFVEAADWIEQ